MQGVAQPSGAPVGPADAVLIARYRDGHDEAATTLLARHEGALRRWAADLAPEREEQLVAATAERAWRDLRRGLGPTEAFRPYLLGVLRELAGPGRTPAAPGRDAPQAPGAVPGVVAAAYASLPERWQVVLWHREVEGEGAEVVAGLLGIEPHEVTGLVHRARAGLSRAYVTARPGSDAAGCAAWRARLPDYVGRRRHTDRELEDHLTTCDGCGGAYRELRALAADSGTALAAALLGPASAPARLGSAPAPVPFGSASLSWPAIDRGVPEPTPAPPPAPAPATTTARRWAVPVAAAAAVLVVVGMVAGIVAVTAGETPADPDPDPVPRGPGAALTPTPTLLPTPTPTPARSERPRRRKRARGGPSATADETIAPSTDPTNPTTPAAPARSSAAPQPTGGPPTRDPSTGPSDGPAPGRPPTRPPSGGPSTSPGRPSESPTPSSPSPSASPTPTPTTPSPSADPTTPDPEPTGEPD